MQNKLISLFYIYNYSHLHLHQKFHIVYDNNQQLLYLEYNNFRYIKSIQQKDLIQWVIIAYAQTDNETRKCEKIKSMQSQQGTPLKMNRSSSFFVIDERKKCQLILLHRSLSRLESALRIKARSGFYFIHLHCIFSWKTFSVLFSCI